MRGTQSDLTEYSLTEISKAIVSRQVSSLEVTKACLEKINLWQNSRNAFIKIDEQSAIEQAVLADQKLSMPSFTPPPLHGVPLAHKDMFYREGQISTCGSKIRRNWVANQTATVLKRLDSAGALTLGTLNMSEFAGGPTGHNMHYGHCSSAYNALYIAGGSSSGSASAVGSRLIFGSLGSDTGGSIRMPASANGVLGLKPTYGRISRFAAMPRSWSLDHVGIIARTARDCAKILQIVAGEDSLDPTASAHTVPNYEAHLEQSIKGLRVGVLSDTFLSNLDSQVASVLEKSLQILKNCGAVLIPTRLADMSKLFKVAETIIKSEAASMHGPWLKRHREDYTPLFRSRIEVGLMIPATQYINALRLRQHLTQEFMSHTMQDIDLLHLPCIPYPLPTLADSDIDTSGDAVRALIGQMSQFTRPINLLGLPAMSIPCGYCQNGLPLAFQLVGNAFSEELLLRVSHRFMSETEYHHRLPIL